MKIFMIAPEPFFEPRGTPISVYQRLKILSKLGHEVDLLTYHLGTEISIPGVETHRIRGIPWIREVKIGPSFAKVPLDILLFLKAVKMLLGNRYDVIHSHEEAAFFCPLLSFLFATPHLYDMHSNLPQQFRNSKYGHWSLVVWLFELFERWVLKTSDVVVTIGSDLQKRVSQINPQAVQFLIENLPIDRSTPLSQGLTVNELKERLQINGSSPIVYTGSFESYQGIGLLLEAAAILNQYDDDIVFIMVGGIPDQVAYWQKEVRELGLVDRFRFVGRVPTDDVIAYLELADVVVSPRRTGTSIPLKIYAYLQAGRPTLATNIDAHTQVLTDETALLVEATAEAFAEGVLRLVRSPELMQQMGIQARKFAADNYDPAQQMAKLDCAYQAIWAVESASEYTTCSK